MTNGVSCAGSALERRGIRLFFERLYRKCFEAALPIDGPAPAEVTYEPRQVGNDMGLWVIGTGWMALVAEVLPEPGEAPPHPDSADVAVELAELARNLFRVGCACYHFAKPKDIEIREQRFLVLRWSVLWGTGHRFVSLVVKSSRSLR